MKYSLLSIIILALIFSCCSSSDEEDTPVPVEEQEQAIANVSTLSLETDQVLYAVHFIDEDNGFVAGGDALDEDAIILRTIDGGGTWKEFFTSDGYYITNLASTSNGSLFATTNNNPLLKSTDGGGTWVTVNIGENSFHCTGLKFRSDEIGYLTGAKSNGEGLSL